MKVSSKQSLGLGFAKEAQWKNKRIDSTWKGVMVTSVESKMESNPNPN